MAEQIGKDGSIENPLMAKNGYEDIFYYTVEVKDPEEITPQLKKVFDQIKELEKEKAALIGKLERKVIAPAGWSVKASDVYDYGYIKACISKVVHRKPPPLAPEIKKTPEAIELEKLQKVLRYVDAKTLFHSNILTKEEKRKLLELD